MTSGGCEMDVEEKGPHSNKILDFITTARKTPDVREIECARLDKNGGGLTTRL